MAEHAVIIGGTSGIGLATAQRLLADGYRVTVAGRDRARLNEALESLARAGSGGAAGQTLDATDPHAVAEFFAALGPLDHLVLTSTAPVGIMPVEALPADRMRAAFDGKPLANLSCIQAARPALRGDGSVVLVSAASARAGLPGTAGLAAINGAVEAMVAPLAVELAPLRVNAVSPGVIDTPWWDGVPAGVKADMFARTAAALPVGRVGRPEDVADAIAFLIGNTFTTGLVLPCDGGALLRSGG